MSNATEMASKGAGAIKGAKATLKGLKGIFRTLTKEHGEAAALVKRVASSSDVQVRQELFPTIRKELLAHERGELSELYPLLQQREDTRDMVADHEREASEMETLLEQLNARNYENPQWGETFARLAEIVEHHTKEEESEYFPRAQAALGEQVAEELDGVYKSRKQEIARQLE